MPQKKPVSQNQKISEKGASPVVAEQSSDEYSKLKNPKTSNTFMWREVSMFESFILFAMTMGSLELGPSYTTILFYVLTTITFSELVDLQTRQDKEEYIQVKSKLTDWLLYFSFQYFFTFRGWCSYNLLVDSLGEVNIEKTGFLYQIMFQYQTLIFMMFMTAALILFTMSLQEGFYAYQLRHASFTAFSALLCSVACQGFLIALWHSRLWFVWACIMIFLQGTVDSVVSGYGPFTAPIKSISPSNTIFGYLCAAVVCIVFHFHLSFKALSVAWFNANPTYISLKPMDTDAVYVDMSNDLYKIQQFDWNLGPLGEYKFATLPADLHMFAITAIVTFLASLARIFYDGVKKALRADTLGQTLYSGGIADHMAAVCIVGLFLFIYINSVIYRVDEPMEQLKNLLNTMTVEAQRELLTRMKDLPK